MFDKFAILIAAGLIGPLLASGRRPLVPLVIGELLAGLVIGRTGLGVVDPTAQPFPFLSAFGFAMLMFTAGTHVDVTAPDLRRGLLRGAGAFVLTLILAVLAGLLVNSVLGFGRPALLVVLLAGSSAAVAFPVFEEHRLHGPDTELLIAWIALADSLTVILMPLTLIGPERIPKALAGDAAIVALTALLWIGARRARSLHVTHELRHRSRQRGWALQLRLTLLVVIVLAVIADHTGGSTLVAGFAAGSLLASLGEPGRLQRQISGLANGFAVPAFFVLLGATLDLRALATDPKALALAVVMATAAVLVHLLGARIATADRMAVGLAASAQLGLPAATAALGLATGQLTPTVAAALVGAGCLTMIPASFGALLLVGAQARRAGSDEVVAAQPPSDISPNSSGVTGRGA